MANKNKQNNSLFTKENRKYTVLIVIFTLVFFVVMATTFTFYRKLSHAHSTKTVSYRLDSIALEEEMFGPTEILQTLYFDSDYESDFDSYWEFGTAHLNYIKGKYADDKTPYIAALQEYIDSCTDETRKETAIEFLNEIQ